MKSYIKITLTTILFCSLFSCEKVIDVDVPNGGERLVIEASILWKKGSSGENQTIKLSKSTEYFANNTFVPVTTATVQIINNDNGAVFEFQNQNDGYYTTDAFLPILNNSYTLNISHNNKTYTATENMFSVSEITNVEQNLISDFEEDEMQIKVFFDDPIGIENYYLGEFIPQDLSIISLSTLKDEYSDGNENSMEYFEDGILSEGDILDIKIHGISERFYNYITLLEEQDGENGPFTTTPAQLKGNCINVNDLNEEVLGFFRLSEVDKISYAVQ